MAGFWKRLLGRKKRLEPQTPAEQVKSALEELRYGHEREQKRSKGKPRRTDRYRELVIKGDQSEHMTEDLATLTADSYLRRDILQEQDPRVSLPPGKKASAGEIQQQATKASDEIMSEFNRLGETPDEHYYRATERMETGEIDRTYEIEQESPEDTKGVPPKKGR